jgi:hypothetical protein
VFTLVPVVKPSSDCMLRKSLGPCDLCRNLASILTSLRAFDIFQFFTTGCVLVVFFVGMEVGMIHVLNASGLMI